MSVEGDPATSSRLPGSDEAEKQEDPIRKIADDLEAATGARPTVLVASYPLTPMVEDKIRLSSCLGSYEINRKAGIITFEVLP